ncbi:sugar ABC transporter permease [Spirochaetia bacterium]|nr:sugar ABC transporter permease [Spirochaetia bacterium]
MIKTFARTSVSRHTGAFWLFVAPCIVLFSVFFLLPLCLSFGFSLTNYDGWKKMDFIGMGNYAMVLQDVNFFGSLGRTFIYALFSLPFKVIFPLLFAVLVIAPRLPVKGIARTMIYMPVLLSALVVGITINWMFSQEYGLVNFLFSRLGFSSLEWALNPALATFVISFAANWASLGFYMIIYIGGLTNISPELYEAACIDGASGINAFFRITLPMLRPTTFLVILLSTVNLLKEYALVQGITQGGPGLRTTFIIQYIFDKGFKQMQYGTASAISTMVMLIFALIAYLQFRVNRGGELAG